jgi:hypothetical protein
MDLDVAARGRAPPAASAESRAGPGQLARHYYPGAMGRGGREVAKLDVFEVLGAAHHEVEQMLDRMQYLIGGAAEPTPELREQSGSLVDALISAVSLHEAAEEEYFWPAVREKPPTPSGSLPTAWSRKPKPGRCLPSWTRWRCRRPAVHSAPNSCQRNCRTP